MIFFAFTDDGLITTPIQGADFQEAAANLKALLANPEDPGAVRVAILMPGMSGNYDPATDQFTLSGDSQTQATIRNQLEDALPANATYLALPAPTNPQVVAQVRALTQQVNGLIRLTVGNFE